MTTISFTEFRNKLSHYMNSVAENFEPVIVSRGKDRKSVLLSWEDFKSFEETAYLLSSSKNIKHLEKSLDELTNNDLVNIKI